MADLIFNISMSDSDSVSATQDTRSLGGASDTSTGAPPDPGEGAQDLESVFGSSEESGPPPQDIGEFGTEEDAAPPELEVQDTDAPAPDEDA